MTHSDPLADMLTRVRNGQNARLASVKAPHSRMHEAVLKVLLDEGFIESFSKEEIRENIFIINIKLKYFQNEGAIKSIDRVSKPGKRVYYSTTDLKENKFRNGLGIVILSTSRGVISGKNAVHHNIGGEVLCKVF